MMASAPASANQVTGLLIEWSHGKREASDQLIPIVYAKLRRLAAAYMRRERPGHTLDTASLVHEAYLRLVDQKKVEWRDRTHFFAIAATLMRRVLVDHARRKRMAKRGGGQITLCLGDMAETGLARTPELPALDEALTRLGQIDPEQSRIVELRFFAGMTNEDIATLLEVSVPTIERRWRMARAWLYNHLRGPEARPS